MKKAIFAVATAATLAVGSLSAPTPAEARCVGCAIGAGVVAGAIIGGAIANSGPRYYGPAPGYAVYEGYGAPYPVACPGGYWARRPIAYNAYGEPIRWSRPRFICP